MSSNRGSASPPTKKGVAKVIKPKKGYNARNRNTWTVPQLKAECKAHGLKVGGRKDELIIGLQVNDDTKKEAAGDEDIEDEHEDEEAAGEDTVDAEKEGEKTPEVGDTTSEPDPTAPPKADKEIKIPGIKKATMSEPYVEEKPADRSRTIRKPEPKRIGADGHPLFRKPTRKIAAGGKPVPKNGYKAISESASPAPVPGFKAKRVEIERAKAYRKANMKIVEQVMRDNGDDDEVFSDAVNQLGKARDELSKIAKAEAVDDEVEEAEVAKDDEELVDDDEEVHEHVADPEDGDFSDGSRKRSRDDEDVEDVFGSSKSKHIISMAPTTRSKTTKVCPSKTTSARQAASTPSPKITKRAPLKTKGTKTSRLSSSITGYSPALPGKDWDIRMYDLAIERNHGGKMLRPTAVQIHEARHARRVQQELRNLLPKVHGVPVSGHLTKTLQSLIRILEVFTKEPTQRDLKKVNYDAIPDRPIW
ncbi:hypothetical protein LTR78_001324 [Recurvomyces mirabilis]|uniref:SAP domain-containing protein n=1 Tax=Recurvomyces mirabilis TaxID=574656 RepID=A0AAE1C5F7_9PEZI|nr:hypothetical protein LTR78_001324 [Recurvomyces mirabilis]KAK5161301.1 hypothetical protein LTS14_001097 [Recurvomyces mirabilis]